MTGREIKIPFGPDTTGSFQPVDNEGPIDIDPVFSEGEARNSFDEERALGYEPAGQAQAPASQARKEEPSQLDEVQSSFVALRASIDQGRELKAREHDREELAAQVKSNREELADREHILHNYQAMVDEQEAIINQNTQQRDARKAELAQLSVDLDDARMALERMKEYHDQQLNPLETELGRTRATAEQTKNDERSRKAELSAAEKEAQRAEGGDSTVASAKLQVLKQAYDEALVRSNAAKEDLDLAQKAYDDAIARVEQAEAPLEHSVQDMESQIEELKDSIGRLGDAISAATKRRQYCDSVYQYPEETAKLRRTVEDDISLVRRMDADTKALRGQLAESKKKAKTAKIALIALAVIIVAVIVAAVIILGRAG